MIGNRSSIRTFFLLIAGVAAAFISFSVVRSSSTPEVLAYVPGDAPTLIVIPRPGDVWSTADAHLQPFAHARNSEVGVGLQEVKKALIERCIPMSESAHLQRIGIDPSRASAIAIFEPAFARLQAGEEGKDPVGFDRDRPCPRGKEYCQFVAALPLSSVERFRTILESLAARPTRIHLSGGSESRRPVAFEIVRSDSVAADMCAVGMGPIARPAARVAAQEGVAKLTLAPALGRRVIALTCRAQFADGKSEPCECSGTKLGDSGSECRFEVAAPKTAPGSTTGNEWDGWFRFDEVKVKVLSQEKVALISGDERLIERTLQHSEKNMLAHSRQMRDIDTKLSGSRLQRQSVEILRGYTQTQYLPGSRRVPFRLSIDESTFAANVALAIDSFETRVIERAIAPQPEAQIGHLLPLSTRTTAAFRSDDLPYFLRWANANVPTLERQLNEVLGNFSVVLAELMQQRELQGVSVSVAGMRGRTPEFLLVMESSPETRRSVVERLQRQLRAARDRSMVQGALNAYADLNDGRAADSLEALYTAKDATGRPLIAGEEASALGYVFSKEAIDVEKAAVAVPDALLGGEQYREVEGDVEFIYLMPPLNENDFRYRFGSEELDELTRDGLLAGRYRLCATLRNGLLWIGSDKDTLKAALAQAAISSAAMARRSDLPSTDAKLFTLASPAWIVAQALRHPDTSIREEAHRYRDVAQYDHVQIVGRSERGRNLLHLSITFSQ